MRAKGLNPGAPDATLAMVQSGRRPPVTDLTSDARGHGQRALAKPSAAWIGYAAQNLGGDAVWDGCGMCPGLGLWWMA